MEIRARSQSEAWVRAVQMLGNMPVVAPRGMRVREASERVSIIVDHPDRGFVTVSGRKLYHAVTAIEGLSLVGQTSVPELLLDRVGAFAPYANDGIFWGAYGPRIAGDLGNLVEVLKRDKDSRQAVLTIFDSDRDLGRVGIKDVPCTLAVQLFLRDRFTGYEPEDTATFLDMWVTMRSNDAWLGLPYDLGQFSLLQFAVAQALGARVGRYTHSVGSLHLYEKDWEAATRVEADVEAEQVGSTFGSSDIAKIAERCRRILLGQNLHDVGLGGYTDLERWLAALIAERDG